MGREWSVERMDIEGVERKDEHHQNVLPSIPKEFVEMLFLKGIIVLLCKIHIFPSQIYQYLKFLLHIQVNQRLTNVLA